MKWKSNFVSFNRASLLLFCLLLLSCKKDNKQYSSWSMNGVSHTTKDVTAYVDKTPEARMLSSGSVRFDITFAGILLPKSGRWPVVSSLKSRSQALVAFYIDTMAYIIAEEGGTQLLAEEVKGKARYTLSATWFINFRHPEDSLLIEGVFNEP